MFQNRHVTERSKVYLLLPTNDRREGIEKHILWWVLSFDSFPEKTHSFHLILHTLTTGSFPWCLDILSVLRFLHAVISVTVFSPTSLPFLSDKTKHNRNDEETVSLMYTSLLLIYTHRDKGNKRRENLKRRRSVTRFCCPHFLACFWWTWQSKTRANQINISFTQVTVDKDVLFVWRSIEKKETRL